MEVAPNTGGLIATTQCAAIKGDPEIRRTS